MATPIVINTGTTGVTLSFTTVDNMVSADLNPDGPQGNGTLGWSRVLEANASGLGYYNGSYSIVLDPFLQAYQANNASSGSLAIVASNWTAGGNISGSISYPVGTTTFSLTPATWTSQQQAYTLEFY